LNFIREKELQISKEKEKIQNTSVKLQNLEKEMNYENDQFKKAYQRKKEDTERMSKSIDERKLELDNQEK